PKSVMERKAGFTSGLRPRCGSRAKLGREPAIPDWEIYTPDRQICKVSNALHDFKQAASAAWKPPEQAARGWVVLRHGA
ncbi:MAG: hypothetical protein O7F10_02755, partial [Deltaproteobacteria bacterium]|nr:hypothetical protein [Deltaproteobacteria bacterium]